MSRLKDIGKWYVRVRYQDQAVKAVLRVFVPFWGTVNINRPICQSQGSNDQLNM